MISSYRVLVKTDRDDWPLEVSESGEYCFCHNDISQHILFAIEIKIKTIVDWEYSGFYRSSFESPFTNV